MNPYRKLLIGTINELFERRLISLTKENIVASDEAAIDCIRRCIDGGLFRTMSHQQGEQ
jgi:hypothetical protein